MYTDDEREEAFQICAIAASWAGKAPAVIDVTKKLGGKVGNATTLACVTWSKVLKLSRGTREAYMEAAELLRDGWSPGDAIRHLRRGVR